MHDVISGEVLSDVKIKPSLSFVIIFSDFKLKNKIIRLELAKTLTIRGKWANRSYNSPM